MQPELETQEAQAGARARWKNVDVELADGPMSQRGLADYLQTASAYVQAAPGRFFPSSFSAEDTSLTVFPRAETWRWRSAEAVLSKHPGHGLMVRLPLFWQVEIPLFCACQEKGLFMFVNDQGNMPLGAAAISRADVSIVITDAKDANDFALFLMTNGHPLPDVWFIVQKTGVMIPLVPALTGSESSLIQEVHVFPGVPILEQCTHIAGKEFSFHIGEGYTWEHGPSALVTGHADDPLPLVRYETGLTTDEAGSCACGKAIVRVQAT